MTRKFKNDALEEILNKFYSYDAIGDWIYKKLSHKSAGIHFIIEPYVTLTFSFNFTAAYLFFKKKNDSHIQACLLKDFFLKNENLIALVLVSNQQHFVQ